MMIDIREKNTLFDELIGEKIDRITIYKKQAVFRISSFSDAILGSKKCKLTFFVSDDTTSDIQFTLLEYMINHRVKGTYLDKEAYLTSSLRNASIIIQEVVYNNLDIIIIGIAKNEKAHLECQVEVTISCEDVNIEFFE